MSNLKLESYLKYLGWYEVFIPAFLFIFLALFFIIKYCKVKGPNSKFATFCFYTPMIGSAILGVLLFYSPYFWSTFAIYTIVFFLLNISSFNALGQCIDDKTGMGVTMFSGLISMSIFFFSGIVRFINFSFFT